MLVFVFLLINAIGLFGFFPTLYDLYFRKKRSANFHSYTIWTANYAVNAFYSAYIGDVFFLAVSLTCLFLSLLTLLGLLLTKN